MRTAAPEPNNNTTMEANTTMIFCRFPSPPGGILVAVGVTVGVGKNEGAVVVGVGHDVCDWIGVIELVGV